MNNLHVIAVDESNVLISDYKLCWAEEVQTHNPDE